jgi:hypothetical protein
MTPQEYQEKVTAFFETHTRNLMRDLGELDSELPKGDPLALSETYWRLLSLAGWSENRDDSDNAADSAFRRGVANQVNGGSLLTGLFAAWRRGIAALENAAPTEANYFVFPKHFGLANVIQLNMPAVAQNGKRIPVFGATLGGLAADHWLRKIFPVHELPRQNGFGLGEPFVVFGLGQNEMTGTGYRWNVRPWYSLGLVRANTLGYFDHQRQVANDEEFQQRRRDEMRNMEHALSPQGRAERALKEQHDREQAANQKRIAELEARLAASK